MSLISHTRHSLLLPKFFPTVQKRYNTRESIHRYVEPNKFKKHMLAAAEPYFRRRYNQPSEVCRGANRKEHHLEPLDRIYANELLDEIKKNDFVLFIQHNYTIFQSERVYKNTLIKSGASFFSHKNPVYKKVFKTLGIDQVQHLFITRNSLVVGPIDKLPACVKALRKMPQFLLLAGCIEGDVLTYDQLQSISVTTDIDECRANLLAILESPSIDLSHYLEQHANNIGKQDDEPKDETPSN